MPETKLTSKMVGKTLKTSAESTKLIPLSKRKKTVYFVMEQTALQVRV